MLANSTSILVVLATDEMIKIKSIKSACMKEIAKLGINKVTENPVLVLCYTLACFTSMQADRYFTTGILSTALGWHTDDSNRKFL